MGNAQQYNSDYRAHPMAASLTLKRGYFVNWRSGYIVEGADTSGDRFAGVVHSPQEVVSNSSRKYNDSKYGDTDMQAYVNVQKSGYALAKFDHTSGTPYVGQKCYVKDGSEPSVQSADDATNNIECGTVDRILTSETDLRPTDTASITSDVWVLVKLNTDA